MQQILGVDLSSKKIALAFLSVVEVVSPKTQETREKLVWRHEKLIINGKGIYTPEVALQAAETLPTVLQGQLPGVAWIEYPCVGVGGPRSTIVQAFVSGVVQSELVKFGWKVNFVNVQTWKKEVIGKGSSSKEQVQSTIDHVFTKAKIKELNSDQDLYDASAIALYGKLHL